MYSSVRTLDIYSRTFVCPYAHYAAVTPCVFPKHFAVLWKKSEVASQVPLLLRADEGAGEGGHGERRDGDDALL
jgi:hypothetical protein